jgi:hypothetical protein
LLFFPLPLLGAQAPRVTPGQRVRLDAPSLGGQVMGTLVAWDSDTLFVRVEGDAAGLTLMLPADSVTRLDVRRERAMTVEGLGIGLLAGALLAAVASPGWVDENGECTTLPCVAYKVSPNLGTRVQVLGLIGAFVGGIVGATTKKVTWAPVPLERLQVGPAPDGGLAVGVRISF